MRKFNFKLLDIHKIILFLIGTLVFFSIAIYLSITNYNEFQNRKIYYKEEKDISYKVYLKPNNFFEEQYLDENQTYIASLIDYINVDFDYNLLFSQNLNGNYTYYIKGILEAKKQNTSSNYYSKEYILSDVKTVSYEDKSSIKIKENINIKYDDYNNVLNDFKNQYKVPLDGSFKLMLVVSTNVIKDENNEISKEGNLEVNIPLTSQTIEVPIDTSDINSNGVLMTYEVQVKTWKETLSQIASLICYALAFFTSVCFGLTIIKVYKSESAYNKKLRKILKNYDGIIVNLEKQPKVNNDRIIKVSSFDELLDAQGEIRVPINYIKEENGSVFLLIFNDYVYKYFLSKDS